MSFIVNHLLTKINILSEVDLIKIKVNNDLSETFKNTVLYGPFKGMKMSDKLWWGKFDVANKIFGQYESHVVKKIIELSKQNSLFIDIGAADGYFVIGMVHAKYFNSAICFEVSENGRDVIKENAGLNNMADKIQINGIAGQHEIERVMQDQVSAVILIDIEGAEFDLLTYEMLHTMKNSSIIIELHDRFIRDLNNSREKLFSRASQFFNITYLDRANPEINTFPELFHLSDAHRFLLFSEGRPNTMDWVCFTPKMDIQN